MRVQKWFWRSSSNKNRCRQGCRCRWMLFYVAVMLVAAIQALALTALGQEKVEAEEFKTQGMSYRKELKPHGMSLKLRPPVMQKLSRLSFSELMDLQLDDDPTLVGIQRDLPVKVQNLKGAWESTSEGWLWRVKIQSPGARAIRIHFKKFNIGQAKLWVYGDAGQVDGIYQHRGLHNNGRFWSDIIFGDRVTVEYQPASFEAQKKLPFRIPELGHLAGPG